MKHTAPLILAVLLGVGLLVWEGERAQAEFDALLAKSRAEADSLRKAGVVLERIHTRDTVRMWRSQRIYDSVRVTDTVVVDSVVYVPRDAADSAVNACVAAELSCERRVANLNEQVRVADSLAFLERLRAARPWMAAGVAWDPHAARIGAFVDRDVGRFRLGVSAVPAPNGVALGVRAGLRW